MIEQTAKFVYKYIFFFLPNGHPWDYVAHSMASLILLAATYVLLSLLLKIPHTPALVASAAAITVIEVIKEINDYSLGKTDIAQDLIADAIGTFAAIVAILITRNLFLS